MESEAAGGSKAIERFAVSPTGGSEIVFALVEIDTGLLAGGEIGVKGDAIHNDVDGRGGRSENRAGAERKLLFCANSGVIALPNAARAEKLVEELYDERLCTVHALCEGLENESVAVAVDDETWEAISLAENQTACVGIAHGPSTVGDGGLEAGAEESLVERLHLMREKTKSDLGGSAKVRGSDRDATRIEDGDGIAGPGVIGPVDVGSVNPDMTGGETFGGTAFNTERGTLLHVPPV